MRSTWRAFKDGNLPENYFRVETIILRYLGIELTRKETLLYQIYSKIFLFMVVLVFTGTEVYELWAQRTNLDVCLALLAYLVTHLLGVIQIATLYRNRHKIGDIIRFLRNPPFAPDEMRGGLNETRMIREVIRKTEIQLTVYFIVISGTLVGGIYTVIVGRITKDSEEWVFPYAPTISIMDLSHSPMYEVGCLLQTFGVFTFAGLIATTYVLLSSIIAHISIQLKILANSFRDVLKRAKIMHAQDKTNSQSEDFYLNMAFKQSYLHHLDILDLTDEMERLCSIMVLAVFLASIGLLCFTLYIASLYPMGSAPFLQNFCFWWIIICQIGMFCYWGNELSLESENVAIAAAEADWIGSPKSISTGVLMVIARSQRPLQLTAGKFVPLSMTAMMNIIKGSFSYFMVLRQRKDEST